LLLLLACEPAVGTMRRALEPDPDADRQVWAFTSTDGRTWRRSARPLAHGFSSLGLAIWGDELVVTGMVNLGVPTAFEERFPELYVDALTTSDLVHWRARRWYVDGPPTGMLDPSIAVHDGEAALWFVSAGGRGDPGDTHPEVAIVRAPFDGERFANPEVMFVGRGLLDVTVARFMGKDRVFTTLGASAVVEVDGGDAVVITDAATVPFALVEGDELWLLTQQVADGRIAPHVLKSTDGATWSPAEVVVNSDRMRGCTSPVMGHFRDQWVLLCVDQVR
jgi:hypothetical protein